VTVSQDDPRPSYVQVADDLRRAVERGEYRPGQRLPSGRALARQYNVALNTAQRAVDVLKDEGVLISYPPRGVFVRSPGEEPHQEPGHSPEYNEITRQIDELRSAFQEQMHIVDQRLSSLEQAIGGSSGVRERDS
jgi:GntR family transcriptional regulator